MDIQDRLLAALRRYCQALPDRRQGQNARYAMADFALAAFAPFFMQSPSFLAHQRHLETGQGRMRVLNGNILIALDGTEYHCSDKIHCPGCSHRKRGKTKIEYFHPRFVGVSQN